MFNVQTRITAGGFGIRHQPKQVVATSSSSGTAAAADSSTLTGWKKLRLMHMFKVALGRTKKKGMYHQHRVHYHKHHHHIFDEEYLKTKHDEREAARLKFLITKLMDKYYTAGNKENGEVGIAHTTTVQPLTDPEQVCIRQDGSAVTVRQSDGRTLPIPFGMVDKKRMIVTRASGESHPLLDDCVLQSEDGEVHFVSADSGQKLPAPDGSVFYRVKGGGIIIPTQELSTKKKMMRRLLVTNVFTCQGPHDAGAGGPGAFGNNKNRNDSSYHYAHGMATSTRLLSASKLSSKEVTSDSDDNKAAISIDSFLSEKPNTPLVEVRRSVVQHGELVSRLDGSVFVVDYDTGRKLHDTRTHSDAELMPPEELLIHRKDGTLVLLQPTGQKDEVYEKQIRQYFGEAVAVDWRTGKEEEIIRVNDIHHDEDSNQVKLVSEAGIISIVHAARLVQHNADVVLVCPDGATATVKNGDSVFQKKSDQSFLNRAARHDELHMKSELVTTTSPESSTSESTSSVSSDDDEMQMQQGGLKKSRKKKKPTKIKAEPSKAVALKTAVADAAEKLAVSKSKADVGVVKRKRDSLSQLPDDRRMFLQSIPAGDIITDERTGFAEKIIWRVEQPVGTTGVLPSSNGEDPEVLDIKKVKTIVFLKKNNHRKKSDLLTYTKKLDQDDKRDEDKKQELQQGDSAKKLSEHIAAEDAEYLVRSGSRVALVTSTKPVQILRILDILVREDELPEEVGRASAADRNRKAKRSRASATSSRHSILSDDLHPHGPDVERSPATVITEEWTSGKQTVLAQGKLFHRKNKTTKRIEILFQPDPLPEVGEQGKRSSAVFSARAGSMALEDFLDTTLDEKEKKNLALGLEEIRRPRFVVQKKTTEIVSGAADDNIEIKSGGLFNEDGREQQQCQWLSVFLAEQGVGITAELTIGRVS